MSVTRDLERGSRVADYRIEAVLGRGGVSVVYLAEDPRLKRRVGLKLLSPASAEDERFRERFLSESELAASLDHANVIPIYEAGEAEGSLFIAMRYVEGSDLKALLRDGPLSQERAVVVAAQVAGALDAAHQRGLVHGDVKPSNVLIDRHDHVYLADFGLTKRLTDPRSPTGEAQLMGTIDYVAPEQIRGDEVDGRADVYSLGCLLHECLTGRQPFRRANDAATLFAHLEDEPPATGTPADPVLVKALAKTADERYPTCGEMVEAARRALGIAVPRRSRLPVATAAAAGAVAVAALLAFFLVGSAGSSGSGLTGRLLRIDGNRVGASVRIGSGPSGLALGNGRVWVATRGTPGIWGVNSRTLAVTHVPWPSIPIGIAVDGIGVGYVLGSDASVTRLDLDRARPMGGSVHTPLAEVIAGGAPDTPVWVAGNAEAQAIGSVSPQVEGLGARVVLPQPSPPDEAHVRFDVTGVAIAPDGDVWVSGDALDRRLIHIRPFGSNVIETIRLPFAPSAVAVGAGAVWVTGQLADVVARLSPRFRVQQGFWTMPAGYRIVRTIKVGREPMAIAASRGAVWVADALDETLSRIDPRTNRVTATIPLGNVPRAIAARGSSVWVAADAR
jgi:serine/threonine-protein kinase